jgi:hypothetical protein
MGRNEKMNRQSLGMLAITLTTVFVSVQSSWGQGLAYPPGAYGVPVTYSGQPAVYMAANPGVSGVYPATMVAGMPMGNVQLAACETCGPAPVYGGPMMDDGSGCYGSGCDGSCDAMCGGGCGGCGLLGGGCGLFGLGCAAGGDGGNGHRFQGYNGQHFAQHHGPYGDGGCCLPRWFDVHVEWLFWKREFDDSLQFSSLTPLGPDALNANQLDFSEESGFRITGAYLLGVATSVEATYFGTLNWASGADAVSPNNLLYSVFSDFGAGIVHPETDGAFLHQIGLSSELDNGEINLRHRWVSANCLLHSSMLVGARYFRLREDLLYKTRTIVDAVPAGMDYVVKTDNDLVGAQLGGDMFLCITPRLKVGAEAEAGVYGTSSSQRTNMTSTLSPSLREYVKDNDVAFVGEAGAMALYRITSQWTLRVGYQVLYVDGVALALDNFNTASPFAARNSFLNNSGDVFYHGATLGFEWTH